VSRRLLSVVFIAATALLVAPAYADESVQFTFGRVVHTTPDAQGRIGIRSSCAEPRGCKVNYTIKRGATVLGGIQALFLAGSVQTDYVTFSKSTATSLRKRRMQVTITADASDPEGNRMTLTKSVTLGPKKKRR
jgi:hypothetical protein